MTMVWVMKEVNVGEQRGGEHSDTYLVPVQTFRAVSTRDTFQSFRSRGTDTAVTIQWRALSLEPVGENRPTGVDF
jgi:hypothetical protein